MKNLFLSLMVLMMISVPLSARRGDYNVVFSPSSVNVNTFRTASFDPMTPDTQPILTNLNIKSNLNHGAFFYMKVEIFWSGVSQPLVDANYITKNVLGAGLNFHPLTNRDLITNEASSYFTDLGQGDFSLDAIIEYSTVLRNAVLAGYFPDGILSIRISVQVQPEGEINPVPPTSWNNADVATFAINVRNAGVIHLVSPGTRVGNIPPQVSMKPVNFVWSAINTGFNQVQLVIKEFSPSDLPNSGSVEVTGTEIYNAILPSGASNFSEFLPFNEDYYYAWQVSTTNYSETNPAPPRNANQGGSVSSAWHVFKFVSDASGAQNANEIQAILNMLNNLAIQNIFNNGYSPTGSVMYNGRHYSGQEAVDLVESLIGQELNIRITD
ncbi:MAG: hypothetical protein Q8M98_09955 [Candidatus Cloacimonadaceae bacterium]|nr:hypothetical protein [Candidatus Cloacimonadaceae bacterium]MDP3115078.1 hypothetical protein [Candidatus Cloacimonadaceae bacterium]